MRILITGYKGFIGQNMVKALSEHDLVLYEWGDGTVPLMGVDRVIHLGAISSTTCMDVHAVMEQNYFFTIDLLNLCNLYSIPIQIASSASIYGLNNLSFCEDDEPNPSNYYAQSKYLVEHFVKRTKFSIPVQLFRYFNVYGPHEDHKGDQASPYHKFRKQALETGVIKLFEGSENFNRDFVPVERIIEVHKAFFDVKESGVWNVGMGNVKSFAQVAQEIADEVGAVVQEIPMPSNLIGSYQKYTRADLTKLKETLKWQ